MHIRMLWIVHFLINFCPWFYFSGKHVYMAGSVISVRVDSRQKQRLDALAAQTGRSGAFYIRAALDAHLDELEYVYALQADAEAVRRGELETISLDDLEAECGLGD